MQTELQLFNPDNIAPNSLEGLTNHEKIVTNSSISSNKTLEADLNSLIPTYEQETKLQKARRILGEVSLEVSDEQLGVFLTNIQFLIEGFLDDFERNSFNGLTLNQILKGG